MEKTRLTEEGARRIIRETSDLHRDARIGILKGLAEDPRFDKSWKDSSGDYLYLQICKRLARDYADNTNYYEAARWQREADAFLSGQRNAAQGRWPKAAP